MLARLEEIPGLDRAEVDFRADFLRLTANDQAIDHALELLNSLGYGAERIATEPAIPRWYGRASVGELSRVEAETIAARVVTRFAETHPGTAGLDALRATIAESLHSWFMTVALDAGRSDPRLRAESVTRAVVAVEPILGSSDAREIGVLLDDDMSRVHRERA